MTAVTAFQSISNKNFQKRRHQMRFGTEISANGVKFKLWAPKQEQIGLRIAGRDEVVPMAQMEDGWHRAEIADIGAGARYKFVLAEGLEIPDPASRFQPEDVHGWSEVIDPESYQWQDVSWTGLPWEEAVVYEMHVGTFTREGTFLAAIDRLDHLVSLGVTVLELMPVGDFPGRFNWGYDGTYWFAPDSSYGRPEDLKALIDAAHARGLMVFLDVVYNHFGPDGNYLPHIAPVFTEKHKSPWGAGINYDDDGAEVLREFVVENATYWVTEYNLDGLRFDAVHAIEDTTPTHLLEILAARVRSAVPYRHVHLVLENAKNQERWLKRNANLVPVHYGAQWNDDVHHLLHAAATGEKTGYYADFAERTDHIGRALAEGFAYQGEMKEWEGMKRGEPSAGLPPTSFVSYIQNHDQVGNRVRGDRITKLASLDAVKAVACVYLLCPHIPMVFMGEEWGAAEPFPFFTDVREDLREAVRKGRMEELKNTPEHEDPTKPDVEETVDPTIFETFASAKLDWSALNDPEHRAIFQYYRMLIDVRKAEIVPRLPGIGGFRGDYEVLGKGCVRVSWTLGDGSRLHMHANLSDESQDGVAVEKGRVLFTQGQVDDKGLGPWTVVWTIEVD